MKFVKNPNLPEKAAAVIAAANIPQDIRNEIEKLNIKIIPSAEINFEVSGVKMHPDMQIVHMGGDRFAVHKSAAEHYGKYLPCICGAGGNTGTYPSDIAYNVAIMGKRMICNKKYTDKKILDLWSGEIINVRQGYSKCSILVVDENSLITSDNGIYETLKGNNMNVLKIRTGYIELPGQNYGFIGGAGGKLAENLIAFTGDITTHPDYDKICGFCKNSGVDIYSLGKNVPIDIGSLLPVIEE